jgi:hypothetical protein
MASNDEYQHQSEWTTLSIGDKAIYHVPLEYLYKLRGTLDMMEIEKYNQLYDIIQARIEVELERERRKQHE